MSEPTLKMKDCFVVDCRDLDKFVAMHLEGFGAEWHALETDRDGYHNGSFASAEVSFGKEIEDDEDQDFSRWLMGEGPFYLDPEDGTFSYDLPDVHHMLQWLCNATLIPDGNYIVKMWW